jgi:hypothetical protein
MQKTLVNQAIAAAAAIAVVPSSSNFQLVDAPSSIAVQATFTYGSGGATVDAYFQTSLDGGLTWIDIAQFHFTTASARLVYNLNSQTPVTAEYTPTDGTLTANTAKDGIVGPLYQVKLASTGTYVGSNLRIDVSAQEP